MRQGPCPESFKEPGKRLVRIVYGDERSEALWRWDKKQQRCVPTPLQKDLDALCEVTTFGAGGPPWVHFCCTKASLGGLAPAGSAAARQQQQPCCASREEAVRKVCDIVEQLFINRSWRLAQEHRWTNVSSAQRRLALSVAANNLVISPLRAVKTHWGLLESLIPSLAREINADKNAIPAKNKLRLLRIVQALNEKDAGWNIALSTVTMQTIDRVLFAVLGGHGRGRATVLDLVNPVASPIVECQNTLWGLLRFFGEDNPEDLPQAFDLQASGRGLPQRGATIGSQAFIATSERSDDGHLRDPHEPKPLPFVLADLGQ